ncbi:T9SS type A sorting domain-containing protein [Hymenobacter elongatus]|uniref:T9SS type A sorting domain-containing protein n=1 Tax=Hymenobacter elongatus TaxID=877208 RepID=UPI001436A707|nr:T9SS type A sorting domain-containing protein [Hymenobacter elongatus]
MLATDASAKATQRVLTLYPNPARTVLSVSLTGVDKLATVKVTDVRGSVMSARYLGNGQVDVADLAPGIYVVSVTDAQRTYHQKFVKE